MTAYNGFYRVAWLNFIETPQNSLKKAFYGIFRLKKEGVVKV